MQSKKKWFILIILLTASLCAAFYFLYFIRTPAYALNQARMAIQEHNAQKFSQYVDVPSVMDNAFEDIIKAESKINNDNIYSNPFALGILHMLKPSVVELMTKEVIEKVAAKNENKQQQFSDPVPDAMKRNLERHIPISNLTIKDLQLTKHEGDNATASLLLHNSELDKDFIAELLMQHNEQGNWQIKKISNLTDFILQTTSAQRAKQAVISKSITERLNKALNAVGEHITINKQANSEDILLTTTVMFKNQSTTAINRIYFDVIIENENGKQLYSYPEHYIGNISPNKALELVSVKKLHSMLPDDKKLMEIDTAKEKIKIQVTYIAFDDGKVLSQNNILE